MALFKSGDDRMNEGNDFIKRKEFEKARKNFQKAIEKGTKDKDAAEALVALLSLDNNLSNAAMYRDVANVLRSKGELEFEFGLHDVVASVLAKECEMLYGEFVALGLSRDGAANRIARGKALIQAGMSYQTQIPNDILIIPEIFGSVSVTGMRRAQNLFAQGNEDLAEGTVFEDPKKAAEYQQIAYNYRKQMGETGEANLSKIEGYSKAVTCWFCGRDVTGERVHFFPMSSEVGILRYKDHGDANLPVKTNGGDAVYACRGCYSAISRRADAIANHYHQQAMRAIAEAEARLNARISRLEAAGAAISMSRR